MPRLGSASAPGEADFLSAGLAAAARGDVDAWDVLVRGNELFGDHVAVADTADTSAIVLRSEADAAAGQLPFGQGCSLKSYNQLHQNAAALAGFLHRNGVRRGNMVAVMLRNCSQVRDSAAGIHLLLTLMAKMRPHNMSMHSVIF